MSGHDKNGHATTTPAKCQTPQQASAMARGGVVVGLTTFVVVVSSFAVVCCYSARVRSVYSTRASALRARASAMPPELPERAALLAEAAHIEELGNDYQRIAQDEMVLSAPTSMGWIRDRDPNSMAYKSSKSYTVGEKQAAADERRALLEKHTPGEIEFAREEARLHCVRDGFIIPCVAAAVGYTLAIWMFAVQCTHPLGGIICLLPTPATFTCTLTPDAGGCVFTPNS